INRAVEAAGFRTSIVDVATMALYNAFGHSYPELPGCSFLIDIGARTTNLLFIEPSQVFTRSIPLGGGSVTAAIAQEFDETFSASEVRKKLASVPLAAEEGAGSIKGDFARVSMILRQTMTRLDAE